MERSKDQAPDGRFVNNSIQSSTPPPDQRTPRWMYLIMYLILLCPAASAAVAAVPQTAKFPTSLSPVILFKENHHFELNELVKEAMPTPAALAQPHPRGRFLGTNWCSSGKPATGVHSLPRNTTCTFVKQVIVPFHGTLELSSDSGRGELAIISGSQVTLHFYVFGDLTLVDLILEKGRTALPGGSLYVGHPTYGPNAHVHLLRSIIRLCESTSYGGAVYANSEGGSTVITLTNSTL